MTETQIAHAEARFGLAFPPDYRLFLSMLHTPDPPMVGYRFEGSALVPSEGREMTDWTGNESAIELAIDWPLRGLLLSIADEGWHERWGPRPEERQEREARVRTLAAAGPQFVPVFGHRYLAGPPDREGNPVLSIYGADVVVYSENLRSWLRLELSVPERVSLREVPADDGARIPFWGDVIAGLS